MKLASILLLILSITVHVDYTCTMHPEDLQNNEVFDADEVCSKKTSQQSFEKLIEENERKHKRHEERLNDIYSRTSATVSVITQQLTHENSKTDYLMQWITFHTWRLDDIWARLNFTFNDLYTKHQLTQDTVNQTNIAMNNLQTEMQQAKTNIKKNGGSIETLSRTMTHIPQINNIPVSSSQAEAIRSATNSVEAHYKLIGQNIEDIFKLSMQQQLLLQKSEKISRLELENKKLKENQQILSGIIFGIGGGLAGFFGTTMFLSWIGAHNDPRIALTPTILGTSGCAILGYQYGKQLMSTEVI